MEKKERDGGIGAESNGVFSRVIGGGTAVIDGKKPTFTASSGKKRSSGSRIVTDPLGSWTGVPEDPDDLPVQDADDL